MSERQNGKKDREAGDTLRALRRASRRARELGARTGTPVYVLRRDRIVDLTREGSSLERKPIKRHAPRGPN
jgi:hypothetical protein